ncbi:MAG: MBL fold metallo-hydrolase [Parcubacteria group bacterium]|nr:MBL fold metallo-hydrolase [Parcubacteria group bacterium]
MKLHFYGGARWVTGSNYLLETQKTKILVDCGLFQGGRDARKMNQQEFSYDPSQVEAVLVTHAHIDHIGRLPYLVKKGFKGKIFATKPTKDFVKAMLFDAEEINYEISRTTGKEPFYNRLDVKKTLELFQGIDYKEKIKLNNEISFCFRDAGHVLGSAIIEVWAEDRKIVFSGDLGNPPVPILRPTEFIKEADYVLVESTYGDRIHEDKKKRKDLLENVIENVAAQKGVLLLPSFALERTQEVLYELNELVENHCIPQMPIFLDSPLAIKLTEIYQKYPEYFNQKADDLIKSGDDIFKFPGFKMTRTATESKQINQVNPPKIILAGSGMSTGGRILHHEIQYLSDPKNTLLIVCYQVPGTLGRKILDGAKTVRIFGQEIPVKLQIKAIGGYSAHADQKTLCYWVRQMKDSLKKVFVVHGEEGPAMALSQYIEDHLGLPTQVPEIGQVVEL